MPNFIIDIFDFPAEEAISVFGVLAEQEDYGITFTTNDYSVACKLAELGKDAGYEYCVTTPPGFLEDTHAYSC